MSDIMRPIPFSELMKWIKEEYSAQKTIFGVSNIYRHTTGKQLSIFKESIETPFGPAAGPHTQLAQNIIASYVGGSRFFELKTVQIIDGEDLPVSKPCILANDECYNVEWSTELRVPEAFEEYVKAWIALKVISKEYGMGSDNGFVFNMSVGYDLEGIKSKKVNTYIDSMKQASTTEIWQECTDWLKNNISLFENIDESFVENINSKVCTSITLSTLHGCPPDEIERIATYLITEKKLNTYIKCNPTLLGYEYARKTMDSMGYDYVVFDDHHFKEDLQYEDAIPMFNRLLALAEKENLEFGTKLTNTFPVTIAAGELPGEEMYMSGKSLYPLSISLADKLEKTFNGKLRVSYSGGADYFNIDKIFNTGIWPITMATTLLKPGGYNRLNQIAEKLKDLPFNNFNGVDVEQLSALVEQAKQDKHSIKPIKPIVSRKKGGKAPLTNCYIAGCQSTCPLGQDVPAYLQQVKEENYAKALEIICEKNPLPFITGTICAHTCMSACTRNFYEEPVQIRAAKLIAAEKGLEEYISNIKKQGSNGKKIAIIGGGPAGMAAAFFAQRAGAQTTIFEEKSALGGIVKFVIPQFRISDEAINSDEKFLTALGVDIKLNCKAPSIQELKKLGYTDIIIAVGAWKHGDLKLAGDNTLNVIEFLEKCKYNANKELVGNDVVVIGGGNTAMDAARAAKRMGCKNVKIVYRRTKRYMPADEEELELAIEDGVEFLELLAPKKYSNGILICDEMTLGQPDKSGRRSPIATGNEIEVKASCVIGAIGEKIVTEYFDDNSLVIGENGLPKADAQRKMQDNVYVIGDAKSGPSTVAEAIGDAQKAIIDILGLTFKNFEATTDNIKEKRYNLNHSDKIADEANRCLECSRVCQNCVDVCPNRSNLAIKVEDLSKEQVIHIDKMCNECGNCLVFCPYNSAPYKDKFTVFASAEDFKHSENEGFYIDNIEKGIVTIRLDNEEKTISLSTDKYIPEEIKMVIKTIIKEYSYCI